MNAKINKKKSRLQDIISRAMCLECDLVPIHNVLRQAVCSIEALLEQISFGFVNLRSPCGKTPLMTAAYYCHKQAIFLLLEAGAVINAIHEESGDTAAHFVTMSLCGHIRQCGCVMALIEFGALIDMKNNDGYTVFELATKNGNHDIGNTGNAMMRGAEES
jgi:ankyrin repeat protein